MSEDDGRAKRIADAARALDRERAIYALLDAAEAAWPLLPGTGKNWQVRRALRIALADLRSTSCHEE